MRLVIRRSWHAVYRRHVIQPPRKTISNRASCSWGCRPLRSNRLPIRHAPANTPGIRHVAFAVDDIDAVVAGLRAPGAELVDEMERCDNSFRLCYVRGPEGIIVELAEQIG
jgi:catechol 2,3-dioxygenase-like lactoylglutathione lyase family enzyme